MVNISKITDDRQQDQHPKPFPAAIRVSQPFIHRRLFPADLFICFRVA